MFELSFLFWKGVDFVFWRQNKGDQGSDNVKVNDPAALPVMNTTHFYHVAGESIKNCHISLHTAAVFRGATCVWWLKFYIL